MHGGGASIDQPPLYGYIWMTMYKMSKCTLHAYNNQVKDLSVIVPYFSYVHNTSTVSSRKRKIWTDHKGIKWGMLCRLHSNIGGACCTVIYLGMVYNWLYASAAVFLVPILNLNLFYSNYFCGVYANSISMHSIFCGLIIESILITNLIHRKRQSRRKKMKR